MNNTPPSNTPNRTPQGQRPTQGQPQRPAQGGQRPTQGQMRPSAPHGPTGSNFDTKKLLTVAIIVTAVLLIVSIIIATAALAFSGALDGIFDKKDSDITQNNGNDSPSKPSTKPTETNNSGLSFPNNLNLPTKAPAGNYISSRSNQVQTISEINSEAAILVKMNGNVSIAEKNADVRVHPASMTKLMTLIVACENMTTTNALLTVEQWMVDYSTKEQGSGIGLQLGEQVSVEDALYLISFNSDTYACLMIAQHIAGSEKEFVKLMNKKAEELKLNDTHFANTTGLYDDVTNGNNGVANDYTYTTCRDMAAIMNYAMNNQAVKSIITSVKRGIPVYKNNNSSPEKSLSAFTRWYSYGERFNNDPTITSTIKVIAGKTGGEDIPSACFVTVAKDSSTGEQYICVVIGRIDNSGTKISEAGSTKDTIKVYKNYIQ